MQQKPGLFQLLKNNRQQLIWMAMLLLAGILLVKLWPESTCTEVVARYEQVVKTAEADELVARLDSLAFGSHCDTFSLVYEKKFWVLNRCKPASAQLRDSLEMKGLNAFFEEWMPQHKIGTIIYHYPNLSIEYADRFNNDYDFRLIYSREPVDLSRELGWRSCEDAEKESPSPDAFYTSISQHWYVSALKK